MIDIFIRSTNVIGPIRWEMRNLTISRWVYELGGNAHSIHELRDYGIKEGREVAEATSTSDPYIFTDDDVLIMGKDWLKRAVDIVLSHHEYAIVSTLSVVEGENQAKSPNGEVDIYDMHAVGAPMIIRKGYCTNLPEMSLDQECGILHKHVLDQGKKMGLIGKGDIRHNHLGHGFSSNPALRWAY